MTKYVLYYDGKPLSEVTRNGKKYSYAKAAHAKSAKAIFIHDFKWRINLHGYEKALEIHHYDPNKLEIVEVVPDSDKVSIKWNDSYLAIYKGKKKVIETKAYDLTTGDIQNILEAVLGTEVQIIEE